MAKYIITGESLRQAPVLKKDNDFYIGTIYTPLHEASELSATDVDRLKASIANTKYRLEAI